MSVQVIARNMYWYLVVLGLATFVVLLLTGNVSAADQVPVTPPVTLQSSLVSIITQVQQGIDSGVGFLKQEIPDVIKQLLVWKAVLAGFWAMLYALLVVVGIVAARNAINSVHEQMRLEAAQEIADATKDSFTYRDDRWQAVCLALEVAKAEAGAHVSKVIIGCILGVVLTFAGIIAFCNIWGHALTVVQIYLAPKVYLIEYAASLVNK